MSDYSVCPEGGFWEEADRPTLSDAIATAEEALDKWSTSYSDMRSDGIRMCEALRDLIAAAKEADNLLKEYR